MLFSIMGWVIYGLVVGMLAKWLHPGDDPKGVLPTLGIGVAGSYMGGGINWLLFGGDPFSASGIIMGTVGGVICCWLYGKYKKK